ncbi:sigma-70 family RNA polymerase sigma factor [Amycolatopsis coloradensis]|uniref:sigma-70 family RNA polymerase sigma factor n=1 Tax=Amycolatopsis coloradensis TaxID=76021 RepID=UPI001FCA0F7E|nr:sigma-70 family RNA polymerase sigma factor [Amycolatopsis coloradensis]
MWASFGWLVTGPAPLSVDGRALAGLPPRLLPLDELGTALLTPSCTQDTRDAAWRHLVTLSRAEGGKWTVACTGLALPVLLPAARTLTRGLNKTDREDIHAAILTGFLEGLHGIDLSRRAVLVRLRWTAYRAGEHALRETLERPVPHDALVSRSAPRPRSGGHPGLVLAAAIEARVITGSEAELISTTRLGDVALADAAHARGQSYDAAKHTRNRAERRLATYLADSATDATAEHGVSPADSALPPVTQSAPAHRVRLRNVSRNRAASAKKPRTPVSPNGPKSGVSERGPHLPADRRSPARRTSSGPAVHTCREARSCD